MKLGPITKRNAGKCYVCGKPTVLLIHKPCGLAMDAKKREATGPFGMTEEQHQKAKLTAAGKAWKAGKVPWFCKS